MQSDFENDEGAVGTMEVAEPTIGETPTRTPAPRPTKKKKRFGNRPVFRFVQVTHRWIALITGVALLLLVITGAVLLYKTPIQHALNHDAYYPSSPARILNAEKTLSIVQKANPKTPIATAIELPTGNWAATDADSKKAWLVDSSTGQIKKEMNPNGGFFGLLDNFHECMLSCEGQPLYIAALGKPIGKPFGAELTWASLILGVLGMVLLVLVVGGLFLWWPGIKRMSRGFKIRRGNRYKFNYDLHKVVGFAALPFLFMWALTGANFEFPFVTNAWYAVLPGKKPADIDVESKPVAKGAKPISVAQAIAAVKTAYPHSPIVAFTRADPSDPKSTYSAYIAHGYDPWKNSDYPGDLGLAIDQFSGKTTVNFTDDYPHVAQVLEEQYGSPTHMGFVVGPWWRLIWLFFGLTPILLGVTGTTTWWIRRGKAKAKKKRRKQRAAAAASGGAAA